jgi:hypothetical protein
MLRRLMMTICRINEVAAVLQTSGQVVSGSVCEDADAELDRIKNFSCGCKHFQQQPCYSQFSQEFVLKRRMEMNELTEGKFVLFVVCR